MPDFLKRKERGKDAVDKIQKQTVADVDPAFVKRYPALAEFLSCEEWEPGVARERGTMTVFFEEGSFKASVNDRDGALVAFVSKSAFTGLLEAIEKGLVEDKLDWRPSRGAVVKKGKRG